MSVIKPISPQEVVNPIPDFVFEAVNELINENFMLSSFILRQDAIKERIMSKTSIDFKFSWLNFEEAYRKAGWLVEYDKPGYDENYDAYFTFKPKDKQ